MRKPAFAQKILGEYFNPALDLRIQSFNLLGFAGMAAGFFIGLSSLALGASGGSVIGNFAAFGIAFLLLRLSGRAIGYGVSCWIVIIGVFMLLFPSLFFMAGGYRSGMPCFFTLALIFTAIMLERGAEKVAVLAAEFLLYAACLLAAYLYPGLVTPFESEFAFVCDVVIGVTVSSALLLAVVLLHIRMHRLRQEEIKELNRELEARNGALERYDRMKSDFLAAVAHEIRTPLDFIVAGSQDTMDLLEAQPIKLNEILDNQEKIKLRAVRIDGIVMDLMDSVAIETGRLPLSRQRLSLQGLLKNACDAAFQKADLNHNRLSYDFQPGLPPIWADPARIEQVMANLISNAVRHTKEGTITVKLARAGKGQTVSVTDDGDGMGIELARAALKQYLPSSSREHWRHGVGLYLCRQIILAHDGEIWLSSQKGQGTTVTFSLMEEPEHE
ncbi:MAG: sensor histidine kinase [Christensenellaceae bacterium]|jgi:signal transduction histidine kinase|nr:sensor histidine kinase [Christensenellaceae bacterium]